MFESVFGSEIPLAARFFIAFLVVLALIGLTAWLVRRFGANRLGSATRGRQPRLAVIDAATIDGRRRLVLIRRDNIEHLLMIGGPTDVVVEPNIVRATGAREPARATVAPEPAARQSPSVEGAWPLQPLNEPAPIPAPRPSRSSATEEPWLAPEAGAGASPPGRQPLRSCRRIVDAAQPTRNPRPQRTGAAPERRARTAAARGGGAADRS